MKWYRNGNRVCPKISMNRSASIVPSNMHMPGIHELSQDVWPCKRRNAQTCTSTTVCPCTDMYWYVTVHIQKHNLVTTLYLGLFLGCSPFFLHQNLNLPAGQSTLQSVTRLEGHHLPRVAIAVPNINTFLNWLHVSAGRTSSLKRPLEGSSAA